MTDTTTVDTPTVDELATLVGELMKSVGDHETILTHLLGQPTLHDWCPADVPAPLDLPRWCAWMNQTYTPFAGRRPIPECWQQHPGLAAEIGTLFAAWRAAFQDAKATPDMAQNWHDRWLPGYLSRLDRWVHDYCWDGNHQPTPRPPDDAVMAAWPEAHDEPTAGITAAIDPQTGEVQQ